MTENEQSEHKAKMPEKVAQDDFSLATDVIDEERRLHLKAFDYWHRLKTDKKYPLFTDLRPDELAPYKDNSLLLEFTDKGIVVRFAGAKTSALIEAPVSVGSYLQDFPESAFARALDEQFHSDVGRAKAAEFEFVEDHLECRGMILPFSNDGEAPHFIMVVSNFRHREVVEASDSLQEVQAEVDTTVPITGGGTVSNTLDAARQMASSVVHLDSSGRTGLYQLLAKALAIYEEGLVNAGEYAGLLESNNLRVQSRAPFTPVLKMVLGKSYDKTRLTEYASALSCAVRMGETSETLAAFLESMPGGIKGCVQEERAFRRTKSGTSLHSQQQKAEETVRQLPSADLEKLTINKEFSLLLVRRGKNGVPDVVSEVDVGEAALASAIKKTAKNT